MVYNTTNLAQFDGGYLIKQGDISSTFGFELLDENCQAITSLNGQEANEILGEGVSEDLNTLKEIADKIASMSGDTQSAVVQKISDLGTRLDSFANLDLVTVYNQAKA